MEREDVAREWADALDKHINESRVQLEEEREGLAAFVRMFNVLGLSSVLPTLNPLLPTPGGTPLCSHSDGGAACRQ